MASKKLTVSFDSALLDMVRDSAERSGMTVSAWLAAAARGRLRRSGADALAQWSDTTEGRDALAAAMAATRRSLSGTQLSGTQLSGTPGDVA